MPQISIIIKGPEAAASAEQLSALLTRLFGAGGEARPDDGDPNAVRLLLPAALLAPLDMADRMERTPKVESVIRWAEGQGEAGCTVAFATPGQDPMDLATASPETILDVASDAKL